MIPNETNQTVEGQALRGDSEGRGLHICVFCSSSNHTAESYRRAAFFLGEKIAENGHILVYGGTKGGLMTAVAEGAKSKNGEIIGVIAQPIIRMKRQSDLPTQLIVVQNLSERKQIMREFADIFVVLPGGFGTLDEMFDVVASGTVGEHRKPLFLANENGFFDHFLQEIKHMKSEKCIPEDETYSIEIIDSIQSGIEKIMDYKTKKQ